MFLLVISHYHSMYKIKLEIKINIFLTGDDYVLHKLDRSARIPSDIRCQLCQDAINEEGIEVAS